VNGSQLPLPLRIEPSLGREDFIVAAGNEDAVRFLDTYPNWPAPAAVLYGPSGSGKSHLVSVWARSAEARIVDAAALDGRFVRALGPDTAVAVENVDSADTAARDDALFALINRHAPLLLTGREPPGNWHAGLPDLSSRFKALLAFALWSPDDALLEALARKLFADRQLKVPDGVVTRMVLSLERAPGAIRDFVARADAKALAEKRPVTLGLIRDLLPPGN
jgi:chromosomal replication initiation ATPase DnaA